MVYKIYQMHNLYFHPVFYIIDNEFTTASNYFAYSFER